MVAQITQTLTSAPTPSPNRNTQTSSEFSAAADNYHTWNVNFVPEINTWTPQANALATEVNNNTTTATDAAALAEKWAENPKDVPVQGIQYSSLHWASVAEVYVSNLLVDPVFSTSTTSVTYGTGTKSFTTQTGLSYVSDMWVIIIERGSAEKWMRGYITSYVSGTGALDVYIVETSAVGSASDWLISQTNPAAQQPRISLAQSLLYS